jgi:hypothetical protein
MELFQERRQSERRRVCFAGEMVPRPDRNAPIVSCAIRGLSPSGATLRAPIDAPLAFSLKIVRDSTIRQARTIWRRGEDRGIAFVEASAAPTTTTALDIRAMRRKLKHATAYRD